MTVRGRITGAMAAGALALVAAPLSGQGPEPMLLDSTAVRPPIAIRVIPENPRPVGGTLAERTVGDPFWVTVRTSGPPGYTLLPQSLIDAYRPHPEVAVLESDRRDALLRLKLAVFRPGDIVLPTVRARVVTDRGDTLLAPVSADTIRVASVLAPGDTLLADIKPLWKPRGIPAWMWALVAALTAMAALAWWMRRRRSGPPAAAVPVRDVYGEARRAIEALREDPPTAARRTAAAAAIGDALRGYLADAWDVPARERTTLELLPQLPLRATPERPALASLLSTIDLAKFARLDPGAGAVPGLADRAIETLDRLEARHQETADVAPPEREEAAS